MTRHRKPVLVAMVLCAAVAGTAHAAAAQETPERPAVLDSAALLEGRGMEAFQAGTAEDIEAAILLFLNAAPLYARAGAAAKHGEMLVNVGVLRNMLGHPDSALASYGRAVPLLRAAGATGALAIAHGYIGEMHLGVGRVDSALAHFRAALPLAESAADTAQRGVLLNNIGIAYREAGRLDSAVTYLGRALAVRRIARHSLGEGVTLSNLAGVHQTLGRPDSALAYLRQSLTIRRVLGDRAGEGTTLNNIGYSHDLLGQPDSALAYYRIALDVLRDTGRRSIMALTLTNIGRAHLALGAADSALYYSREGLVAKREIGDRAGEAWALTDLGRIELARGRPDIARAHLEAALAALRDVGDRAREGNTLYQLARAYHRDRGEPRLDRATAYYDSAAALRAVVGAQAGHEADRLSFAEQDVGLFAEWALAWLARAPEVGPERAAWAALAAVERGRAQALLDLMRASGERDPDATSQSAGTNLAELGARLGRAAVRDDASLLSYFATDDTLLVWLVRPDGEVATARTAVPRDSLEALVADLRAGLGVDDASSGAQLRGGGAPLETLRDAPRGRRGLRYAEAAAGELSGMLLPPRLAEHLPPNGEVVVVPHGPLALLPFAALPLGRTDVLVEPFATPLAIRYAPSVATLVAAEDRAAPLGATSGVGGAGGVANALVVGNPAMPEVTDAHGQQSRLAPLPRAEQEAERLAARLGAHPLIGEAATTDAVRERLPTAPLVHLATHGYAFASEARARDSFVALAPDENDDGLFTVGELLDDAALTLTADLVVLSACQTGLGDLNQAEGTVGLQRALLARGARSVLVSLWSVSDLVTDVLMERFYDHWLDDGERPSKAEALRRAQEDVKAMAGFEHPRFWAAFQLVGAR